MFRTSDAFAKSYPVKGRRPPGRRRAGLKASLECVFVRFATRKMEGDPGARRGSHKKVGVSDVETRASHPCNEAKLPRARSIAATGQNQGTSLITQLMISI